MKDLVSIDPVVCMIARNICSHIFDNGKYAVLLESSRIMLYCGMVDGIEVKVCANAGMVRVYKSAGQSSVRDQLFMHKLYNRVDNYVAHKTSQWGVWFNHLDTDMYIERN